MNADVVFSGRRPGLLYLDLETYSDLDLRKVSLDRYASHPSTRILMCAFAGETGDVDLWSEADGDPAQLAARLKTEMCIAWNVGFERTLIYKKWGIGQLNWFDVMVLALYAGLPAGLKDCNRAPFFANESETSKETLLINKFCKPSKTGTKRDRNTDPEDWAAFCQYCMDDVHDTRLIHQWLLKHYELPERVCKAWQADQRINERGMPVDRLMAARAWCEAQRLQAEGFERLKALTGLENPNSCAQLLKYVTARGYPFNGLGKELVRRALTGAED